MTDNTQLEITAVSKPQYFGDIHLLYPTAVFRVALHHTYYEPSVDQNITFVYHLLLDKNEELVAFYGDMYPKALSNRLTYKDIISLPSLLDEDMIALLQDAFKVWSETSDLWTKIQPKSETLRFWKLHLGSLDALRNIRTHPQIYRHYYYQPGMPGYQRAKSEFERLRSQQF